MEFTPRLRQIVLILLEQKEAIPVKLLAEKMNISKRTVQRELEYLPYSLKKYQLKLESKTGVGIWIMGEIEARQRLWEELQDKEVLDSADKQERRKRLMLELLRDQSPKKLYYYGNLFGVSESTISNDLERIEPQLNKFHIHVLRKQGLGIMLQGTEKDYRTAIRQFILENMDTPIVKRIYEGTDTIPVIDKINQIKLAYSLLDDTILHRVGFCIASIQDSRISRLTEESYVNLVIHITIAIERVLQGEIIEKNEDLSAKVQRDECYSLALLLVDSLEAEFDIEIPDVEIIYICLHIKGSKVQKIDMDNFNKEVKGQYEELVHEMIVAFDTQLETVLEADEEFVQGLISHMGPTLVRLRNKMQINNPHLEEIKQSYPDIFYKCEKVGRFLDASLGCDIPEAEIGFLTIHFGAALVRLESERESKRVVDIGVVCASGIGISRLMVSRLEQFLKTRVRLTTYGFEELTPYIIGKNDFFVSSIEMGETDYEILYVSPLLPDKDLTRIEEKVSIYETQPRKNVESTEFTEQLDRVNNLSAKIKGMLRGYRCLKLDKEKDFKGLLEEITEMISPSPELRSYIINDVKKREEIATQVIPELDIALFHARTKGVTHPCFYTCNTTEHERFTHPYMQQVKGIVLMLIPDNEEKQENSDILGFISSKLVEDENFLDLIKAGAEKAILQKLGILLKKYFNQYLDRI